MLGDQKDRVDGDLAGAQGERIGNRRAQPNLLSSRVRPAEIRRGQYLLGEQAGDLERRLVKPVSVVHNETVQKSADDVVGV